MINNQIPRGLKETVNVGLNAGEGAADVGSDIDLFHNTTLGSSRSFRADTSNRQTYAIGFNPAPSALQLQAEMPNYSQFDALTVRVLLTATKKLQLQPRSAAKAPI